MRRVLCATYDRSTAEKILSRHHGQARFHEVGYFSSTLNEEPSKSLGLQGGSKLWFGPQINTRTQAQTLQEAPGNNHLRRAVGVYGISLTSLSIIKHDQANIGMPLARAAYNLTHIPADLQAKALVWCDLSASACGQCMAGLSTAGQSVVSSLLLQSSTRRTLQT